MTLTGTLPLLRTRRYGSLLSVTGWVAVTVTLVVVLLSLLAPVMAPYDPDFVDLSSVLSGPSAAH